MINLKREGKVSVELYRQLAKMIFGGIEPVKSISGTAGPFLQPTYPLIKRAGKALHRNPLILREEFRVRTGPSERRSTVVNLYAGYETLILTCTIFWLAAVKRRQRFLKRCRHSSHFRNSVTTRFSMFASLKCDAANKRQSDASKVHPSSEPIAASVAEIESEQAVFGRRHRPEMAQSNTLGQTV